MSFAIFYHQEAYSTNGPKLMGRNAAGESFLRGFFKYSKSVEFWAQVIDADQASFFDKTARSNDRKEPVKAFDKRSLNSLSV